MKNNSYIRFNDIKSTKKTKIIGVSNNAGVSLGLIKFWGPWRQYTFQPDIETVFNVECMKEIIEKIDSMNEEIRAEWSERRKNRLVH